MFYSVLADAVVGLHFAFLVFTLVGQVLILVGAWRGWCWVRNPWFRCTHLAFILFVASEYVIDFECPLTDLEKHFRTLAGEEVEDVSFIGRMLDQMVYIFDGLDTSHWGFT